VKQYFAHRNSSVSKEIRTLDVVKWSWEAHNSRRKKPEDHVSGCEQHSHVFVTQTRVMGRRIRGNILYQYSDKWMSLPNDGVSVRKDSRQNQRARLVSVLRPVGFPNPTSLDESHSFLALVWYSCESTPAFATRSYYLGQILQKQSPTTRNKVHKVEFDDLFVSWQFSYFGTFGFVEGIHFQTDAFQDNQELERLIVNCCRS